MKKLLKKLEKSNIENKDALRKLIMKSEINENGTATFTKNVRLKKGEFSQIIKIIEEFEGKEINENEGELETAVCEYMTQDGKWHELMWKVYGQLHGEELEDLTKRKVLLDLDLTNLCDEVKNYMDGKTDKVVVEFLVIYRRF